jgi:Ni/Fe-hydrogenase subunit HybB-like protein
MISAITIMKNRSFLAVGLILLTVATLIGLWSIYDILSKGLIVTNLTQYVPWGIWIAAYVFFATGLAAGSFFLSTLVYVFKMKHLEPIGKLALLQTFAILSMGLLLVFLDLGKPAKLYLILTSFNPSSLLAWLFVLYGVYLTIIVAKMYFAMYGDFLLRYRGRSLKPGTVSRYSIYAAALGIVGIVFAIFTRVTSASFFAVVSANPNWFGAVLPVQFLLLGFVSGGALLMTLSILFMGDNEENRLALKTLSYFILGFLVFHFLILILEFFITLYAGTPAAKEIYIMILFGRYWYIFWFVQFGLGILVPVTIIVFSKHFHFIRSMFLYGIAVFVGSFGFFLNFVIPGQINPNFKELPESHHHMRYAEGYMASFTEWALFIGCVAFFIWILLAGLKYLPVIDKTEEKNS